MRSIWHRLQTKPIWLRWPAKWLIFAAVVFVVLYPNPVLFVRHVQRLSRLDTLPDPAAPGLAEVSHRLDAFLAERDILDQDAKLMLEAVDHFVRQEVAYTWDWDLWGVVDYIPTVEEVLAHGREDCDGRAVLAAALLRARGIPARLVGDPRHMWVWTPVGETMGPLGKPAFEANEEGLVIDWKQLADLRPLALGISVFPFGRDLIILLAAWGLLLPYPVSWPRALTAGLLLLGSLMIFRLAGQIHWLELTVGHPLPGTAGRWNWIVAWGLLHLVGAVLILNWRRPVGR